MHRRIFACVLCAAVLLTLGACSNQDSDSTPSGAAVTMGSVPDQPAVRTETSAAADSTAKPEQTKPADANSQDSVIETTTAPAQQDGLPTFYAEGTAKAADKTMDVTVNLAHNPGFQLVTVRMYYDPALTPVDEDGRCTYTDGSIVRGGMSTCPYNAADHLVGFVAVCSPAAKDDGDLFTVKFHLPEDAKAGDSYQFTFDIVDFSDGQGNDHMKAVGKASAVTVE